MHRARTTIFRALLLPLLFTLTSCCLYEPDQAADTQNGLLRVVTDWTAFDKEVPTGMTVKVFPQGDGLSRSVTTNDITHADFNVAAGQYNIFAFNQSTSEFNTVEFSNMDSYHGATVTAVDRTSSWYTRADKERLVYEPEWIAVGNATDVTVRGNDTTLVNIALHNIICTVTVRIHVPGISNLRSFRGALTGVASGFNIAAGTATSDTVTYVMEKWTKILDADDPTQGILAATFTCFGLPTGHLDLATSNRLDVSALLVDGTTQVDHTFYVGDKFEKGDASAGEIEAPLQVSLKVDVTIPDPLPDVDPKDTGGFDVVVDDWGKPEDVNIDM